MKKINKITIIGVGLIGGSIGLAIKKKGLAKEVAGVFRRSSTLYKALKRGAVDKGFMSVKDGVKGADLVIVATPVSSVVSKAREAMKYAKPGAVITDVGSTKGPIVDELGKSREPSKVSFVGSHPMAGSESSGVEAAREDLMEKSPCIVTKTPATNPQALKAVIDFWRSLGSMVSVMTPSQHDKSVAMISHLPHIVAFGLAGAVSEKDLKYAAEGFKDTTRVASSDPNLWADIFFSNRKEAMKACRLFEISYRSIVKALANGDRRGMIRALTNAKIKRDHFTYAQKA